MHRVRALALVMLGAGALVATACGKDESREPTPPTPTQNLDQLRRDHPGIQIDQRSGQIARVYGAPMRLGTTPRESADAFVQRYAGVFSAEPDDLRLVDPTDKTARTASPSKPKTVPGATTGMLPLMYDRSTGQYRFYLAKYEQYRDALRVANADLRVLVANAPGSPVVFAASTAKSLGSFNAVAKVDKIDLRKANEAVAESNPRTDFKSAVLPAVDPQLTKVVSSEPIVWTGSPGAAVAPRAAVLFVADNYGNPSAPRPEKWRFVADAQTGDILHLESLIVFADVPGTVSGMVTTTPREMHCDPPVEMPFPWADVRILSGASAQADADGAFVIPNSGSSSVTVESKVAGKHFNVFDYVASRNEVLQTPVTPPTAVDFLHNAAASSEFLTGQANAYYDANVVRDWVLAHNPSYPDVFAQVDFPLRVNEPNKATAQSLCAGNAWYDGAALNFCASYNAPGSGQDYGNTAFASVAQHEYGHHLVDVAGSGQDQYGEGMGDVISALVNDDPRLGLGFFASACGAAGCCNKALRSADNNCQYDAVNCSVCGTPSCGHCGSEIHACGELLSGAFWDLRQELELTNPGNGLDIASDLALNSILLHTGTSIDDQIVIDLLTLDDDDGNIENGTPHETEICNAFEAHGLNCPSGGTGLTVSPVAGFEAEGPATGPFSPASRTYKVENLGGGSIQYDVHTSTPWLSIVGGTGTLAPAATADVSIQLNAQADLLANGVYPATVVFTNVTSAVDVTRNVTLTVGRTKAHSWNLDVNPGWTMMGQWAWGTPTGGGGTIGSDNFGNPDPTSGFTGTKVLGYNLSGNYPTSLAQQHLTTTAIDCSNLSEVSLRFRRWLCVEESTYDHARVSVSTNLSTWTDVWTNAQTLNGGYWTEQKLDISAVADGAPTVYVRWTMGATDTAWQYCGWNLDDIEVWGIPDPECTNNAGCDDGLYCNGAETCVAGTCHPGTAVNCADSVSCTVDSCNEATDSCTHVPTNATCDDGLYCNGAETCDALLGCKPGTPVGCADSVSCTVDSCNEATDSCDHVPTNGLCNDGLYCNGAETCDALLGCQPGTPVGCADSVSCTVDSCNEATDSCDHVPTNGLCDDGLYCNGTETCNAVAGCQAGAPVNCADLVACTVDSCNEATDSCNHVATDALCDDGSFCNGPESCNALTGCQTGSNPCVGTTCNEATDTCAPPVTAKLETSTVMVGGTPVVVPLAKTYVKPVVVASLQYANNTQAVVIRVRNVTASSFELFLQRPYGGAVATDKVNYLVVEEGVWNIDGVAIEAHRYSSTTTDTAASPVGVLQAYGQPYVNPVVLGQVMTTNDPRWSQFWCSGSLVTDPPSAAALRTGKRVDDDKVSTRVDELVGYVVMEAGHGTIGGVPFEAGVGPDTVMGIGDAPPYLYTFTAPFSAPPQVAVVDMAGRDGGEGGWVCTFGASPTTPTTMKLATDDVGASGRTHLTEQAGYAVFQVAAAYPPACTSDAQCDDGVFCNGAEHCVTGSCHPGSDPCSGGVCDETTDSCTATATARLETSTVMVGGTPLAVPLTKTYVKPVVVASLQYANNTKPVVIRVRNVTASSFELFLQRPYGGAVATDKVNYLVVEEGVWNIDGVAIEAHRYSSTTTDTAASPVGVLQAYGQPYVHPVVLGQVMTTNDPRWSQFWCSGSLVTDPPSAAALRTGKRVDDDVVTTRADELVGYVVMEAGHGTIAGVPFEAGVGPDSVMGIGDAPPYLYTFTAPFSAPPQVAVVDMAGRDGGEGGWVCTFGASPTTTTTMKLATDDVGASGRTHLTEQAGYAVFQTAAAYPPTCASDAQCDDGVFCNGAEHCITGSCHPGSDPCGGGVCNETTDSCTATATAKLETSTVMVGGTPVVVTLANTYLKPVVVASLQYANNTQAVVTRVRNVTASSFEIFLQRPYGGAVATDKVNYLVVEEGVWNIGGVAIEAHRYLSTTTDTAASPVGVLQAYGQPYVNPVVLGQVMTTNDPRWSQFWCSGTLVTDPPSAAALRTGKRVDDDVVTTRADELVGYVVMEAGHGTIAGVPFEAGVGPDSVMGIGDVPPYLYTFTAPFSAPPQVAVVAMAGRDGGEGGWACTFSASPMTTTTMKLATDDVGASGRTHLTEQVGYAVFQTSASYSAP